MWWESLSLFVFISLFHCWFSFQGSQISMYLPAFGVFIVANFVRFQPGAMDNTKIFIAAWFPLACCAVAHFLLSIVHRARTLAFALFIASTVSGTLCVLKSLSIPYPIFSSQELDVAIWSIENTPIESVFLTAIYPGIPVTSIAGRTALMTFPGWAWTHGIYNTTRHADIERMWQTADPAMFVAVATNYALRIQSRQQDKWEVDPGDSRWLKVFAYKDIEVWEVVDPLIGGKQTGGEEEAAGNTEVWQNHADWARLVYL
jgi:hypothetical protein